MEIKLKTNCYELQNFYFEFVLQAKAIIIEKVGLSDVHLPGMKSVRNSQANSQCKLKT